MKKLLLGAIMAALFVSGDAEASKKRSNTLDAATKRTQNVLPDTLIVNKYMPEGYNTYLDTINTQLAGQLSIISQKESIQSVVNFKTLLTRIKTLIEDIQLVGKQSTKKTNFVKKMVKRTPTITSIQTSATNVINNLDAFLKMKDEGIDSFMETSHAKNHIQGITDSFRSIRNALVTLERKINPSGSLYNQNNFLLRNFCTEFGKFVTSWEVAVRKHRMHIETDVSTVPLTRTQSMPNINTSASDRWSNAINRVRRQSAPAVAPAFIPPAPPQPVYDEVNGRFMSQQDYDALRQRRASAPAAIPATPARPVNTSRRASAPAAFIPPAPGEIKYVDGSFVPVPVLKKK